MSLEDLENLDKIEKKEGKKNKIEFSSEEEKEVLEKLKKGGIFGINIENLSEEFLKSSEVQEAVLERVKKLFQYGSIDDAIKIKENFPIPQEKLEEGTFEGVKKSLQSGWINIAIEIKENFPISQEKLESDEIQEAAIEGIKKNLQGGRIKQAIKIKENFPISQEKLESAEVQEVVLEGIKEKLQGGEVYDAIKIKENFPISQEKLESAEVQEVALEEVKKKLQEQEGLFTGTAIKIKEHFLISQEKLESAEVQEAALEGIKKAFQNRWTDIAIEIKENFPISQERLEEVVLGEVKWRFQDGLWIDDAIKIKENFPISQERLEEAVLEGVKKLFQHGWIDYAIKIKENISISQEKLEEVVFEGIRGLLKRGLIDKTIEIKENFPISQEKLQKYLLDEIPNGILSNLVYASKKDFIDVFREMIPEDKINPNLTYVENIQNYILRQREFENAEDPEKAIEEFESLSEEEKYKKIFENLSKIKNSTWDLEGERSDIAQEFLLGVKKFGYKKMFEFIQDHNRHDALFAFDKIIALQEKSGLSEDDFYGKILYQVVKDNSIDENERDSYAKLNDIAQKFAERDIDSLAQEIEELDIQSANKLLEKIKNKDGEYNFFQNWKVLQKVADFEKILAKKDVLEKIKGMPEKHQVFYEKLIFHPNIDTSAIIQMIEDPEGFLNRGDVHSSELLHELSKAGNFYQFEYSNLTAREIIDMMIDGELDKIQKIPVFEMEFKIPVEEGLRDLSTRQLLRKAIGIRGEGAEAKRPKKIYQEVNDLIKRYNQENKTEFEFNKEFIDNENIQIPEELEKEIREILLNEENGFESKIIRFASLAKSDPDGIIAGTDTASCDAYGAGKKNTYIFNPNIGNIVIQEKRGNEWKTLSQATVTLDYEIDKNISEVRDKIENNQGNISEILDENILKQKKKILSLDSIEGRTDQFLKGIWSSGVFELVKQMSKNEDIDTTKFIQGSYQGLVLGRSIENNYISTAIMGYSDNTKRDTSLIEIDKVKKIGGKIIKEVQRKEEKESLPKGIFKLDSSEALKVSYLEGKIYSDISDLQEYLFKISNTLVGQDYESIKSPKMSFKYENSEGKMEGYIVAYEANFSDDYDEEKIEALYINDLAALPDAKMAGGKLITAFVEEYMKNYIDKGKMMPIATHARDKTSYKIILKQMNKIGKKYNIDFEMEELNTYQAGDSEMHELVIYPKKK